MAEDVNPTQQRIANMMAEAIESGGDLGAGESQQQQTTTKTDDEGQQQDPPKPGPKKQPKPAAQQQQQQAPPDNQDGDDDNNSDPLFLRKPTDESKPSAQAQQQQGDEVEIPDEAFYARLSKSTNGAVKDEKGFIGFVNSYNQLVEEQQKGWEPKFKSEQAKRVHELLTQSAGAEPEAAIRLLRAVAFKAEGKKDKEILFQQYLMDPKNSDLDELSAKEYFEAEYDHKYELLSKKDEELTPEQKRAQMVMRRELKNSVDDAKASIKKIQDEFSAPDERSQGISKEVSDAITKAVGGFNAAKFAFVEDPQEIDYLNVPFTDPKGKQELMAKILNPDVAYNEFVEQFRKEDGNMDWNALTREIWERENHKMLREQAFEQGRKRGLLEQINKNKNSSTPKDISRQAAPQNGQQKQHKNVYEAWGAAQQSKG